MQNCAYRKLLNLFCSTHFVYISIKSLTKVSKLLKMLGNWGLKETKRSYEQKVGFAGNQWQNTWKSNQIGQWTIEKFDTYVCLRFDCYCQKLIFRGKTGHCACVSTQFWNFSFIS